MVEWIGFSIFIFFVRIGIVALYHVSFENNTCRGIMLKNVDFLKKMFCLVLFELN